MTREYLTVTIAEILSRLDAMEKRLEGLEKRIVDDEKGIAYLIEFEKEMTDLRGVVSR
jgi:hypothetical protein